MKLLQRTYPLVGILLLSGGILLGNSGKVLTTSQALSSIKKTYNKVFPPGENIFTRQKKGTHPWYKMLFDIQSYVVKNAPHHLDYLEAFAFCWNLSWQLINAKKFSQEYIFLGKEHASYSLLTKAQEDLDKLEATIPGLTQMINKLRNKHERSPQFADVNKVLLSLLERLKDVIGKLDDDSTKLHEEKFGGFREYS